MGIIFIGLLRSAVTLASLIILIVAIHYRNIEAAAMFFISLVCFGVFLIGWRYWIGIESVDVDLITNFGIAGLVCFLLGLFFLFYPKGKSVR